MSEEKNINQTEGRLHIIESYWNTCRKVGASATCTNTYGQSTLKKGLNLKKLSGDTFLPYGYVQTYRAKFGRKAEKKERTHPVGLTTKARQGNNTTCQQRRGRKVTNRRQNTQVSTKREWDDDAIILLTDNSPASKRGKDSPATTGEKNNR
jgi:hypothetical protein